MSIKPAENMICFSEVFNMLLRLLFLFVKFAFTYANNDRSIEMNIISDFLKIQQTPTIVSFHTCWSKEESVIFAKMLASINVSNKILNNTQTLIPAKDQDKVPQTFIINLDCNESNVILTQAELSGMFSSPYKWIILGTNLETKLRRYYLRLDSKIYLLNKLSPTNFYINSLYKIEENSVDFIKNDIALWVYPKGFSYFNRLTDFSQRKDLQGITIGVSYAILFNDTLNHLEDYGDKHIESLTKITWKIVHQLESLLNVTTRSKFRPTWGYKNASTGIYSGTIGDLQLGITEIGGSSGFFTMDRIDIVEFIAPTAKTFLKFIFRAPPLSYVSNVFVLPFDTTVWYSCFAFLIIVVMIVYLILTWENSTQNDRKTEFFDAVLLEVGAVTQQGTELVPKSNAGKIAAMITLLIWMFLYTAYSANIVALLQSTTDSIRTLEDLLNSRISLGVDDVVYAHHYFENAQEPVKKAIYEQKVAPKGQKPNFMPMQEGVRRVQQGFFAFHVEVSSGYKIVSDIFQESEKCGLQEIAFIDLIEPWIPVKKNSSYKEVYKTGLKMISESGIQKRESKKIYTDKPVCLGTGNSFVSVGILDCYGAFMILGAGICCSLICFIAEFLLIRCKNRNEEIVEFVDDFNVNESQKNDVSEISNYVE